MKHVGEIARVKIAELTVVIAVDGEVEVIHALKIELARLLVVFSDELATL